VISGVVNLISLIGWQQSGPPENRIFRQTADHGNDGTDGELANGRVAAALLLSGQPKHNQGTIGAQSARSPPAAGR